MNHSCSPSSTRAQRGAEAAGVAVEPSDVAGNPPHDGCGALVEGAEPIEDGPVVGGVAVVVRNVARSHLPVVADPEELDIERQETFVAAGNGRFELASGRDTRPHCVRGAAVARQPDGGARPGDEALADQQLDGRVVIDRDEAAEPNLVQQRVTVVGEHGA